METSRSMFEDLEFKESEMQKTKDGKPSVLVIILNWNGWGDTIECLESIFRISYPNYRVIVVDNGSTDGSIKYLKMWADGRLDACKSRVTCLQKIASPPVTKPLSVLEFDVTALSDLFCSGIEEPSLIILGTGRNLGFSGGNNVGLKYARKAGYDYALILNNDVVADPGFLDGLVDCATKFPRAGIVAGKVYHYARPNELQGVGSRINLRTGKFELLGINDRDEGQFDRFMKFSYLGGCCLLVKREVLDRVGFLDENYFMYSEDVDYCLRAWKEGFECVYTPHSKIWHKWGRSSNPKFVRFMTSRNRIYLARKHLTTNEFRNFLLHLFLINAPKMILGYLKSNKVGLIKPYISGIYFAMVGSDRILYSNRSAE